MATDPQQFFYETFGCLCGYPPYPWQEKLFSDLVSGKWPQVVPLPTGSGKTSVLHIWLLALAWSFRTGAAGVPRRLAWVVNRRVVVDQVTDEAAALVKANGGLARCTEVSDLLRQASVSGIPLAVSTLRGQRADKGEWASDPSTPAILIGTVDMIGSRLLFRGYRSGGYYRPMHAGLLGVDTLIINDEAHLSYAFAKLLEEIHAMAPAARLPGKCFHVMLLSATTAESNLVHFQHDPKDDARESDVFRRVFEAAKTLAVHEVDGKAYESTLFKLATEGTVARTLVFIEQPEKAAAFISRLEKEGRDVALLTGTMRGFERDQLAQHPVFAHFLARDVPTDKPVWLVATSAGEVGVNITCERLVTGLVEADHLVQRFGRLNRFGGPSGEAHLLYPPTKEQRLISTLEYLRNLDRDISCRNIWEHQPPKEACSERPDCARLEDRLIGTWAQTTYKDKDMPAQVAPWLHGKQDEVPETELAWRADVSILAKWGVEDDQIEKILDRYPLRAHERLREPTARVIGKIHEVADRMGDAAEKTGVIQVESDGSAQLKTLGQLRLAKEDDLAYRLLILPDTLGKLDRGMFRPEPGSEESLDEADWDAERREYGPRCRYLVDDSGAVPLGRGTKEPLEGEVNRGSLEKFADKNRLRFPLKISGPNGEGLLLYFSEAPKQRNAKLEDVPLLLHQAAVAGKARLLAERVGLASMADSFDSAGAMHDRGKHREAWQRAFGGNMDEPIAKSRAPVNPRLVDRYRHELGSLVDADGEIDDLVLHLVASHHKGARPYFTDLQLDRDNVKVSSESALEAARRYARLQRQFGPWGLAYLEAIFKTADGLASDQEGGGVSE